MRALLLPITLVSIVGVAASMACSTTVSLSGFGLVGPDGATDFGSITFGDPCDVATYYVDGPGYVVCYNGEWGYTTDDPSSIGDTLGDAGGGGNDGGADVVSTDSSPGTDTGTDSGPTTDSGPGTDGGQGQGQGQGEDGGSTSDGA
jgi:hypothetical protein